MNIFKKFLSLFKRKKTNVNPQITDAVTANVVYPSNITEDIVIEKDVMSSPGTDVISISDVTIDVTTKEIL